MHLSQQKSLDQERPHRLERSPHPYSRRQDDDFKSNGAEAPECTGRPTSQHQSGASSDSETQIDKIRGSRLLPAPQPQRRKGLRIPDADTVFAGDSPFLSPSQLHEDLHRPQKSYFESHGGRDLDEWLQYDTRSFREKFVRRRKAELLRRIFEALALAVLCILVLNEKGSRDTVVQVFAGLRRHITTIAVLFMLYPVRLLWPRRGKAGFRFGKIRVPSAFDPALILYPPILPVVVSLSLSSRWRGAILANLVLGLSTLPSQLVPFNAGQTGFEPFHWILTLMPITIYEHDITSTTMTNYGRTLDMEMLTLLFPLHQALLPTLYFLTTSSLLHTELQLLSVALVNVLLLSLTPQALILRNLLWIGGLSLFLLCVGSIQRNVTLERIPAWRSPSSELVTYRNYRALSFGSRPFTNGQFSNIQTNGPENIEPGKLKSTVGRTLPLNPDLSRSSTSIYDHLTNGVATHASKLDDEDTSLRRVQTVPDGHSSHLHPENKMHGHLRSMSFNTPSYASMTSQQIKIRKILFTIYSYVAIVFVILVPVRISIGQALHGWEPIGWAVGYLFGDVPGVRDLVAHLDLTSWVPFPQLITPQAGLLPVGSLGWVDSHRHAFGGGNVRLAVFAYWAIVIAMGLVTVLKVLPEFAEVDTRRKVFHGMMVVMLLPSTFIDPCFLALALTMVLAVFLLLEVIRAGQLRPISQPLARFITPYVDGRDNRGPIVVSHIFLLIGCAIPLWLSLAAADRRSLSRLYVPLDGKSGEGDPWGGWELAQDSTGSRDISMVAGVICVGLGDSAASLIGRRYGRHKWPWAGGKSLEGSAAFAVAVTVGIIFAKAWLSLGGWQIRAHASPYWSSTISKAIVAASGASFTEAVLTGANDNVVVPIVLWLLVRGLSI